MTWAAFVTVVSVDDRRRRKVDAVRYLKAGLGGYGLLTLGTATWKFRPVAAVLPFTWNRARISTTPGCVVERWGVSEMTTSFLLYAVYDGRFGVAGLGTGAATGVTGGLRSNKLMAAEGGACWDSGEAEGVGESKRPRISAAVVFCGCEEAEVDVVALVVVDVAVEPPKISARRSSLVLWPPDTATTGSEEVDISSPSRSTLTKGYHGSGKRKTTRL